MTDIKNRKYVIIFLLVGIFVRLLAHISTSGEFFAVHVLLTPFAILLSVLGLQYISLWFFDIIIIIILLAIGYFLDYVSVKSGKRKAIYTLILIYIFGYVIAFLSLVGMG